MKIYPISEQLGQLMESFINPETGELVEWWRDPETDMVYQIEIDNDLKAVTDRIREFWGL